MTISEIKAKLAGEKLDINKELEIEGISTLLHTIDRT
jgi:hypothetical protein